MLLVLPVAVRAQVCVGDCDDDRHVSVAELITGIDISLGRRPASDCKMFDEDDDDLVTVGELVTGISAALHGCPRQVGTFEITIPWGGLDRTALVTVPESLDLSVPVPLVLNFHGVIATSKQIQRNTRMQEKAALEGFITAAPQGIGKSWNAGLCCGDAHAQRVDDVGFTRALIAALQSEYDLDPARIYATGFSNGAAMVFRLGCEMADVFAAVAPVSGSLAISTCEPSRQLPILVINNVSDPVVPFTLGQTSFNLFHDLNACDAEPQVTEPAETTTCSTYECAAGPTELCAVTGLGHIWPGATNDPNGVFNATDAVWSFFESQVLPLAD